jgi:hypothetical protein
MAHIELSQDELKMLAAVVITTNYKLQDAAVMLPISEKILKAIIPDPKIEKPPENKIIT